MKPNTIVKQKKAWLVCWYEDNYIRCNTKEDALDQVKQLLEEGVPATDIDVYEAFERKLKATVEII